MAGLLPVHSWSLEPAPPPTGIGAFNTEIDYSSSALRNYTDYGPIISFSCRIAQLDVIQQQTSFNSGKRPTVKPVVYNLDIHVPPEELQQNFTHEIGKNKVRGGWKLSRNGKSLDSIEVSGKTGVFYRHGEGVTRVNAAYTYAHAELMELLQIYRNNGVSYDPQMGVIDTIGEIIMTYEGHLYRGSFDSFNIEEDEANPFTFSYSFSFSVRGDEKARMYGHFVSVNGGQITSSKSNPSGIVSFSETSTLPVTLADAVNAAKSHGALNEAGFNGEIEQTISGPPQPFSKGNEVIATDILLNLETHMILPPSYPGYSQIPSSNRELLSGRITAQRAGGHAAYRGDTLTPAIGANDVSQVIPGPNPNGGNA